MDRPYRFAIFAILCAAFLVRCAAGAWWQARLPSDQPFFFPDSHGYWSLARAIAEGRPYVYGEQQAAMFRAPGFPLLLAPLFLAWRGDPPVMAARLECALFGTLSVAGVMWLARQAFDARVGIVAGVLAAFDPGTITQGVFILSEAPFCPLLVAQLGWMLHTRAATSSQRAFLWHGLAGAMGGLATLVRPSWLLFSGFSILWIIGSNRTMSRRSFIGLLAFLAAWLVAMFPWMARNYALSQRFVPTTSEVGASLYDGLNPTATGASDMRFMTQFIADQRAADTASPTPPTDLFELRLDARLRQAAISWASDNPARVLQLAGSKFIRMWTPWPNASDVGPSLAKLALAVGYVPILVAALLGVWQFRHRSSTWLLVAPAIYFTLLHCIFVSSLRYRGPAMLPFMVLAAAWLVDVPWRGQRASSDFASSIFAS